MYRLLFQDNVALTTGGTTEVSVSKNTLCRYVAPTILSSIVEVHVFEDCHLSSVCSIGAISGALKIARTANIWHVSDLKALAYRSCTSSAFLWACSVITREFRLHCTVLDCGSFSDNHHISMYYSAYSIS